MLPRHALYTSTASLILTSVASAWATPAHDPDGFALVPSEASTVFEPPSGERGSFSIAYSIDRIDPSGATKKRVFVAFTRNEDVADAILDNTFLRSDDDGETFNGELHASARGGYGILQLRDGSLIDVSFKSFSDNSTELEVFRSYDLGKTWTTLAAPLSLSEPVAWLRVHRGTIELEDGTLILPIYVRLKSDNEVDKSILLQSKDGGKSWSERGKIAVGAPGYNETSIVQVVDGSLLAVLRTVKEPGSNAHGNLRYTRSYDGGSKWDDPKDLLISFDGQAPTTRRGVAPALLLMPNGVLVLSSGRPDNWIALSTDGRGEHWEYAQITYVNYPKNGERFHGSSGYTGLATLGSNRLLLVGDNCANTWGCKPGESGWTVDNKARIWKAFVDVLTPNVGKIDLAGKVAAGSISVETNMTWTTAAHPEARTIGAFDGSNARWSSAFSEGQGPGEMTFWLDRMVDLTRVGLCLHPGQAAEAQIYASVDGVNWGEPVATLPSTTHYALTYFDLPSPVRAGAVKVVVPSKNNCGPEFSGPCSVLNEIELYTRINSFENDPLHTVPRGYENNQQTWTTASDTGDSSRALRLKDSKDTAPATTSRFTTSAKERTLEFRVKPIALPNALIFDILGDTSTESGIGAYHLAAFSDGSLNVYDYATSSWSPLPGDTTLPVGAWSTIRLIATTSSAIVCVDGEQIAKVQPSTSGLTSLTGHSFSSAGTVPTGDHILIDDVLSVDELRECADDPPLQPWQPDAGQDGGTPDGGTPDGGTPDGGTPDGGTPQDGAGDGGNQQDAANADTSTIDPVTPPEGCACSAVSRGQPRWWGLIAVGIAGWGLIRRKQRARRGADHANA